MFVRTERLRWGGFGDHFAVRALSNAELAFGCRIGVVACIGGSIRLVVCTRKAFCLSFGSGRQRGGIGVGGRE
ncbi:MAG: hypothetical protein JOZ39_07985 [Chloroflexi bacterium]|nr:hypothetical protein [Chloroflexota bacterium]